MRNLAQKLIPANLLIVLEIKTRIGSKNISLYTMIYKGPDDVLLAD